MNDEADYRPVSTLAVTALAAGLCSTLALLSHTAWVVPILGVGLSAAALSDIRRSAGRKAGRLAALAGLALALGCGTQAVTATLVSRWISGRRAVAAATVWIDAVREGRLADAMQVCAPMALPTPDPDAPRFGQTAAESAFAALPVVEALADCASARPAVRGALQAGGDTSRWTVRAGLDPCGEDRMGTTMSISVAQQLVTGAEGMVDRWTVTGFGIEPDATALSPSRN
jgi:hypothetical protein